MPALKSSLLWAVLAQIPADLEPRPWAVRSVCVQWEQGEYKGDGTRNRRAGFHNSEVQGLGLGGSRPWDLCLGQVSLSVKEDSKASVCFSLVPLFQGPKEIVDMQCFVNV